jgi:putative two-component system response regulator
LQDEAGTGEFVMLDQGIVGTESNVAINLIDLPHRKAERFLIVDDDPNVTAFLTELLSIDGFLTDIAHSVNEAIQRLNDNTYQMVLSDLRMPGLSGQDLVRHVTTHYPDTAVIMITGVADVHSAVEALTAGAYDYLTKPFTVAELQSKVFRALERRQLILQNRQYQSHLEQRVHQQTAELQTALRQIEGAYGHTLEALISALDAREHETQRHSKRVSDYTLLMAGQIGIPQNQLVDIERGSLLHDIGKIGISDKILLKPGKLTEEEWVEIRKHPDIGYRILEKIDFLKGAAELVLQHHERFDGSGYPRGISGEGILLGARIFAVVDTFDAMTSDRPYRKALSYRTAREEIAGCSGKQFDPQLVECFLSIPEAIWFATKQSLRT